MASDNVEKAMGLLRGLASGDRELTTRHVSPNGLVQHDPTVADGVDGLREQAGRSVGQLAIVRVLEDGPFVMVHERYDANDEGCVFFAVFRFENGFLVEHWRFSTPLAPPNRSGHTQTDGPTEPDRGQDTDSVKCPYPWLAIRMRPNRANDYTWGIPQRGIATRHFPRLVWVVSGIPRR